MSHMGMSRNSRLPTGNYFHDLFMGIRGQLTEEQREQLRSRVSSGELSNNSREKYCAAYELLHGKPLTHEQIVNIVNKAHAPKTEIER